MAETSSIEWTDATWNPITGCTLVSEGCRHCYAATLAATRLRNHPSRAGLARLNAAGEAKFTGEVRFNEQWLEDPIRWRRPRRIFVCAHGDLFHEAVPDAWIDRVFYAMASAKHHIFQILTKRPERAGQYLLENFGPTRRGLMPKPRPLANVWIGTSVEDQAAADDRIPHLLAAPAAVRFLSAEPLLRAMDLSAYLWGRSKPCVECPKDAYCGCGFLPRGAVPNEPAIDWVIVGGESGPGARPMHPDWARSLRDQCAAAGVPFFHKQNGAWAVVFDRDHDDPDWRRCDVVARDTPAGRWLNLAGGHGFHGDRVLRVVPVSKKAAGRLLDGREHNGMPGDA